VATPRPGCWRAGVRVARPRRSRRQLSQSAWLGCGRRPTSAWALIWRRCARPGQCSAAQRHPQPGCGRRRDPRLRAQTCCTPVTEPPPSARAAHGSVTSTQPGPIRSSASTAKRPHFAPHRGAQGTSGSPAFSSSTSAPTPSPSSCSACWSGFCALTGGSGSAEPVARRARRPLCWRARSTDRTLIIAPKGGIVDDRYRSYWRILVFRRFDSG
jgi:hypothetical protein